MLLLIWCIICPNMNKLRFLFRFDIKWNIKSSVFAPGRNPQPYLLATWECRFPQACYHWVSCYLFSILLIVWVAQLLMYLTVMRFSYPRWCQCMLVGKKQFYSFLQFQFRALFFRRCFLQCFLVLNWPFFILVATFFPCSITFNGYIIYAEINDVIFYWKYMFLCNTIISFWWEGRS